MFLLKSFSLSENFIFYRKFHKNDFLGMIKHGSTDDMIFKLFAYLDTALPECWGNIGNIVISLCHVRYMCTLS